MNPPKKLRLLLIEDSPDDELMVLYALKESGFEVEHRRIENEEALNAAIKDATWDVIISDYRLPKFNGIRALECVRAWNPEIPFFFVSGTVHDDTGVKAMEMGANDYLLKENLARLGPALRRELGEFLVRKESRVTASLYEAILSTAKDAIITVNEDFCITLFNQGAENMFGFSAEEALDQPFVMLLNAHIKASIPTEKILKRLFLRHTQNPTQSGHLTCRKKDGAMFPAELNISKSRIDGAVYYTAIVRDVTERAALEHTLKTHNDELEQKVAARTAELENARAEAEAAAQAKSDFLSNMSHEIRTPLNAILGLAYMLGVMELPEEAAELAQKIHHSGQSLLGIIDDILDFSKIEAGRLEIENEPFFLGEVLDNLSTIMNSSAANKELELVITAPPVDTCYLIGDPLRLGQILINLCGNAIKFTQSGSVELITEVLHHNDSEVFFRFSVKDTGIGIDEKTRARLFSPFVQADASTTRKFGGTGLGLAICKRLVDMMGGAIHVVSTPTKGSTFSIDLAFKRQQHITPVMQSLPGLRLLLAEDNPTSFRGISTTIESMGWLLEGFSNAETLCENILRRPVLQSPQTVLLLNAKLVAQPDAPILTLLIDLPAEKRPITLVIGHVTHQYQPDDHLSHHIDGLISKPISPSMLYLAITRAHSRRVIGTEQAPTIHPNKERIPNLSILIVDDSDINREVAERILLHEGARILQAADGQQAVALIEKCSPLPDIILMDIHMPVMDGLEATRKIRAMGEKFAKLPIVALTAGALPGQQDHALASGMNAFISKPFSIDAMVEVILSLTQTHADHAPPQKPLPALPQDPHVAQLINEKYGLLIFHKMALFYKFLTKFMVSYETLPHLGTETDQMQYETQAFAHKLRGAAGNLGLERLADAATNVEYAIKQRHNAHKEINRLKKVFAQTKAAINALPQPDNIQLDYSPHPASAEQLQHLLKRAITELGTLNPDHVAPVIAELKLYLTQEEIQPIEDALAAFNFSCAEELLRHIATTLHLALECPK